jgi:hypothetical protein
LTWAVSVNQFFNHPNNFDVPIKNVIARTAISGSLAL